MWCNLHGHCHPKLDAALNEQLQRVAHVTNLGMSNPTTIELAKRLVDFAPPGLNHVFFSDDGATAVEVALKMAFQYWRQRPDPRPEKSLYVALGDAYHGDTLGGISVGGVDLFTSRFAPLLFEVIRLPAPDMYRLPAEVTQAEATAHYLRQAEQILAEQHQRIAAFVIEPLVQCAAGIITHPPGYLRGLRQLCSKYNVLLIADEVAVGFGRTGKMFACEHEQVTPDLLCLAKGLTAGYMPLAATLATDEIWQAFLGTYAETKTFFHGHTYGGNPLGAAVALANLQIFDEEKTLAGLQPKIARLAEHLNRISRHPHVGDVRQCGLIAGVELVRDKSTKAAVSLERAPWLACLRIGHGRWRAGPPAGKRRRDHAAAIHSPGRTRSRFAPPSSAASIMQRLNEGGGRLLGRRLRSMVGPANQHAHRQRPAGSRKSQPVQLFFELPIRFKTIGISPHRHGRIARAVHRQGVVEFRF